MPTPRRRDAAATSTAVVVADDFDALASSRSSTCFKQVFDLLEKREREGEGEGDELELSLELKSRLQGLSIPASKYANKRRNARQDITRLRDEYVAYVAQHAAAQHIVSRHGAGSAAAGWW